MDKMQDPKSAVFAFFRTNKLWVKREEKGYVEITHTLLNGAATGRVSVPWSLEDDLNRCIAQDMQNSIPCYINEIRTEVFPMFFDFDCLHSDQHLTVELVTRLMSTVHAAMRRFYPSREEDASLFMAIVCTAKPKTITPGCYKLGLHVHFPELLVKSHEALLIRQSLLIPCMDAFGTTLALNGWEDVIDNAVYLSSGCRRYGSHKTAPCDICKQLSKTEKLDCQLCGGWGKMDEERPYTLHSTYRCGGLDADTFKTLKSNIYYLLKKTTVRSMQTSMTAGFVMYENCPSYGDMHAKATSRVSLSRKREFAEEKQSVNKWRRLSEIREASKLKVLQEIVHRYHMNFGASRVISAVLTKDRNSIWIQIDGDGSNFCLNKGSNHSRNRVWFSITRRGIVQRCHCSCKVVRKQGTCKDFSSPLKSISPTESSALFAPVLFGAPKGSSVPMFSSTEDFLDMMSAMQ